MRFLLSEKITLHVLSFSGKQLMTICFNSRNLCNRKGASERAVLYIRNYSFAAWS